MKIKSRKLKFTDLPTDYLGLCGIVVPRPIHDRVGYECALEIIEAMAGFEEEFNADQNDYFGVIADFAAAYENSNTKREAGRPKPLTILRHLLEENGMSAADLSRLLGSDRTLGAKILRGDRNLTVPHLRLLAHRFKVSADLFV